MKQILSLCILLGSFTAFAQKKDIQFGDIYVESYEYEEAITSYKKALTRLKDPAGLQYVYSQLAFCYTNLFQYTIAEEYFDLALNVENEVRPSLFIEYGKVLKANGKYSEARHQFMLYNKATFTHEADPYIYSLDWAIANAGSVNNYRVMLTNLEVSGQALGYSYYGKGLIYCHGRNKPKQGKRFVFDIDYAMSQNNIQFVKRDNFFYDIQFGQNEISPCLSKDETQLYFAANAEALKNGAATKGGLQLDNAGVSNYKIYVSRKKDGVFKDPEELPFNNLQSNYMHPCISEDGKILVFSSDRPGGYGGFDLYKSELSADKGWSEPENLGSNVNTSENEIFPWVSVGLLFFSSKGFKGYGGYDIYIAELNGKWMPQHLKNMGKPINSFRDDVAFMSADSGTSGYFSSNRGREDGADEVYFFSENRAGIVPIAFLDIAPDTGEQGMSVEPVGPAVTASPGKPVVTVPPVIVTASPVVKSQAAMPVATSVSAKKSTPVSEGVVLQQKKMVFPHILFPFNDARITGDQLKMADSAVTVLKMYPALKLDIKAYTDSRGGSTYNQALSDKRVNAVRNYMIRRGVSPGRISAKGFGETQPLNECVDGIVCSEEKHAVNRRVEMTVYE